MTRQRIAGVIAAMTLALCAMTTSAEAQGLLGTGLTVPVAGTGPGTAFTGAFNIQRFVRSGDSILAVGTLVGQVTNTVTGVTSTVIRQISAPLDLGSSAAVDGVCQVLALALGPLDLNLLGLAVHLDPVLLNIDAVSGAGNLLGNLVCAVANLLGGGGPLGAVTGLLNVILGILG